MSIDATPHSPTSALSGARTLPPEALELAQKLFDMARRNDPLLLEYLSAGIPPNLTNSEGDTLLMLAAYHGHAGLVAGLISRGADVNGLNGRGQSPLSGAVFKDHQDVVRVLVENGADARIGRPDSVQTAGMFKRAECAAIMGVTMEEALESLPQGVFIGPHGNMS
ncbi:ankyrin [Papiliotrema laurentii]|jgi:ankyrin repeat protein|uniref:Ankyrin n=1 Tax=Papiliotrema laurentii TaxID=5418 RepID=A0AAD9L8Z3_PAPLA|nr:ankyrin [Papiliotrema laurentii]